MSYSHPSITEIKENLPSVSDITAAELKKATLVFFRMENRFPTLDDLQLLGLCIHAYRAADDIRYERAEATLEGCRAFMKAFSDTIEEFQ